MKKAASKARIAPAAADPIPIPAAAPFERLLEFLLALANCGVELGNVPETADVDILLAEVALAAEADEVANPATPSPRVEVVVTVENGTTPSEPPSRFVAVEYSVEVITVTNAEEELVDSLSVEGGSSEVEVEELTAAEGLPLATELVIDASDVEELV